MALTAQSHRILRSETHDSVGCGQLHVSRFSFRISQCAISVYFVLVSSTLILLSFICFLKKGRTMETFPAQGDPDILKKLVSMKMPFGKYKGIVLCNLPVSYLEWFARKGFPPGNMGMLLSTLYEIKINGLMYLLEPLKNQK